MGSLREAVIHQSPPCVIKLEEALKKKSKVYGTQIHYDQNKTMQDKKIQTYYTSVNF